jgi:chromosome segregation ATPase
LAIAAALVGWAVVLLQDRWLDGLEDELAAARQQKPAPAADSGQSSADLKQLRSELEASEAERATLNQLVRQSETELKLLRAQLDRKTQAAQEPGREFHTLTRTRMRAGPTLDAEEIAVIAEGASLRVIDTVEDGTWHEVRLRGYAFHELLKPSQGE